MFTLIDSVCFSIDFLLSQQVNCFTNIGYRNLKYLVYTIKRFYCRALQSSDVETDAPYSLNPREAEILQVKNISSTVSPTSSVSDSGIGLDSSLSLHEISSVFPSLLNNDLESAVNYTPNHENSYCDAHLNKPDTTEKRRVPDGLTTGECWEKS